nr:TolC family protein [Kiritimatiellia bacterium]
MHNSLASLFLLLFLAGCVSGPGHQRPEIEMPDQWSASAPADTSETALDSTWWTDFQDPTLTGLIELAMNQNPDILIQIQRVEEFRARLGLSRAEHYPTLGGQLGAVRERVPDVGTYNQFSVSGLLGYELDVWGRLAREREAAGALLAESEFARETVRLGIATDVAVTYFQLCSAQRQLDITRETIASREQSVHLQEIRLKNGISDELVLEQARSEWETARAELPLREQRVHILEGALGILTGLTPRELWNREHGVPET